MSFGAVLALLVATLVVAPVVAHMLRRRKTDLREFPPAALVPAAPPIARRRSNLEDRALFAIRALSVLALAVLGATPLVRCSRLAVGRRGGGSLAIVLVVDDSLSMRAKSKSTTRLERALGGAREVLGSLREGDSVAIVAAGAPARIVLAATTDLASASRTLDHVTPTDRATDLDGALSLAASLVRALPQPDRRVVVLSDLADGKPNAEPLGTGVDVPVWVPLGDLRARLPECGVVRASARAKTVRVHVACGFYDGATPHFAAEHVFAHLAIPAELRSNVEFRHYEAGHMMYVHEPSRIRQSADLAEFIRRSTPVG